MNSQPTPSLQTDAALSPDAIDALYLAYYDGRAAVAAELAGCSAHALLDVLHARNRSNLGEVAILFEGQAITYERLFRLCEGCAAWLKKRGVRAGDHVAIATGNRPEFVFLLLALSRLGAAAVLINTQLEGESLQHLLEIADPRLIATSDEMTPRFEALPQAGTYRDRLFNVSGLDPHMSDDDLLSLQRETPSAGNRTLCFLSTSGSTGLPKLVPYTGGRLLVSALAGQNALNIGPRDVMYVCLPLYHANGLMLGVMGALVAGATVLLRSRFSASSFWSDCIAHKVTAFVYVGEVCRFLLRRTSHEASEGHCVRRNRRQRAARQLDEHAWISRLSARAGPLFTKSRARPP
jgi:fatty-acyl-CoA synthase